MGPARTTKNTYPPPLLNLNSMTSVLTSSSLPSLLSSFQDCLAEGRSVSLPASAVGASKLAVTAVGAYARIRKQFRVPIAEMGGVQVTYDII